MQREMDVYEEWKTLLGDELAALYLPTIFYFDKSSMVVVMEFLEGYQLLDHVLVADHGAVGSDYNYHTHVATCLGDFMGKTHAQTHSSKVSDERKAYLTTHFENREMRDVQLEFVFTKCYKEATDEQRAGLTLTPEFMEEVQLLKDHYNGQGTDSLVLTHGDLHPGSVMVDPSGRTKVIDPEFTVYGPPGLDVGSLLSGYCLGAIHQAYSNNPEAVERIVDGAQAIWDAYAKAMLDGGIEPDLLKSIEIESVGFTVAEVCRTALEFAGGRKWLQFEDPDTKAAAKKAALQVVDKCMIGRHTGGMELLLQEMKAVAVVAPLNES
jgi:5-methylthioribose kinase